jgi:hypothetical protein
MTDWNLRDIFELCTGRCGHKWVRRARKLPGPFGQKSRACGSLAGELNFPEGHPTPNHRTSGVSPPA